MFFHTLKKGFDTPVGAVIAYAGAIDENQQDNSTGTINNIQAYGWALCDGSTLQINLYPELYQSIGTLYNTGSEDEDHFTLPDYRGYFLRGDSGDTNNDPDKDTRKLADETTSDSVGSIQEDALQSHTHGYDNESSIAMITTTSGSVEVALKKNSDTTPPKDDPSGDESVRVSTETRPKNIYVNYLIKFAHL